MPTQPLPIKTGTAARHSARDALTTTRNTHLSPGYIQTHLVILPSSYAQDFRNLCLRNPVALPLIAESSGPGVFDSIKSRIPWLEDDDVLAHGPGCDLRADVPAYDVYADGKVRSEGVRDVRDVWRDDGYMGFVVGSGVGRRSMVALLSSSSSPSSSDVGTPSSPPLYRTHRTRLLPSGIFTNIPLVVSMQIIPSSSLAQIRSVSTTFSFGHGEPIDWGWDALDRLGIEDIDRPDWGEAPGSLAGGKTVSEVKGSEDEILVFWASGRTIVEVVEKGGMKGDVAINGVGCMLVLDCLERDLVRERVI